MSHIRRSNSRCYYFGLRNTRSVLHPLATLATFAFRFVLGIALRPTVTKLSPMNLVDVIKETERKGCRVADFLHLSLFRLKGMFQTQLSKHYDRRLHYPEA